MSFTILKEEEFTSFIEKCKEHSFMQTVSMSNLLRKRGFETKFLGWKSNNEITNLKKLLNKIKIENMKYVNEIEELNLQLNELNDAFTVEKQEKLKYVNEIKILNIKIRDLSRIRRNGFM